MFALSEFIIRFKKSREIQTAAGCSLIEYFPRAREDGLVMTAAGAAVELIRKTVQPGLPLPALFDLTLAYLKRLDASPGKPKDYSEKLIWLYLIGFLKIMGFAPSFSREGGLPHMKPPVPAVREELVRLEGARIGDIENTSFRHGRKITSSLTDALSACFEKNLQLNCLDFYYNFY